MFSKEVVCSDVFLDMPPSTQLLYFQFGMEADDDGFIGSPNKLIRAFGANKDEMKILISKGFMIPFETGVIVIRHWKENNQIRSDRYKETIFSEEKSLLTERKNGWYELGIPKTNQMETQYSIGKGRLGKVRKGKDTSDVPSQDIVQVIDSFKEVNQSYGKWYANQTQRLAITRLIENQTLEKVLKVINLLPKTNGMQYMPTITTPLQLEDKWSQLESSLLKKKNEIESKRSNVI